MAFAAEERKTPTSVQAFRSGTGQRVGMDLNRQIMNTYRPQSTEPTGKCSIHEAEWGRGPKAGDDCDAPGLPGGLRGDDAITHPGTLLYACRLMAYRLDSTRCGQSALLAASCPWRHHDAMPVHSSSSKS